MEQSIIRKKAGTGISRSVSLSLAFLIVLLVISTVETGYTAFRQGFSQTPLSALTAGWINDLIFWFHYSIYLIIAYVVIHYIRPALARLIFLIIVSALCVIDLLLNVYFSVTSIPLGSEVFKYSKEEIKQTLGSSGVLSISTIALLFLAIAIIAVSLRWLSYRLKPSRYLVYSVPLISLLGVLPGLDTLNYRSHFRSDFTNNLVLNKSDIFYSDIIHDFSPQDQETDIYAEGYLGMYYTNPENNSALATLNYIDEQHYPFLHRDSTPDVLSPFFRKSERPPNIVIILVEGLGRAFSNEGAYLGSFTPFLDSLSDKSLYFSNFLSSGGRTFAVLPSLLASLPLAENGFLELGDQMPPHLSLLNLLKTSGYTTSFYYGGDSHFDNMDIFLRKNGIDELNDGKTFPAGYTKLPAYNGFSWGYNDAELYRRYLNSRNPDAENPQLNILLTVSSHSPFLLNEQDKYLNLLNQHLKGLKANDNAKSYQNYKYEYASILYTDDALKTFFDKYSRRKDFKNTIFLITGDHRMPEIPMSTKIDRYHVPLIIYSPLLKRTARIESVSSHFDITPSLLSFLNQQYGIKRPSLCTWMGQGLDTSRNFRNIHSAPLIQTKTKLTDFIRGKYHLNGESVYQLSENMEEEIIEDKQLLKTLSASFDAYNKRNAVFLKGRKLLPDSVLNRYYRPNRVLSAH